MSHEKRIDCDDFEPKRWPHDCGDCQTDGHYLCAGCKHIAPFDEMEEGDNIMRYYPKEEKQSESDIVEENTPSWPCPSCGKNEAQEAHICPYGEAAFSSLTECTCCKDCEEECFQNS